MGEDLMSLLHTNSRENREITVETARMINCKVTVQATGKLDEIKVDLNSQFSEAIKSTITEKVLPSIQSTLGKQGTGLNAKVVRRSARLENSRNAQENCPKMNSNLSNGLPRK